MSSTKVKKAPKKRNYVLIDETMTLEQILNQFIQFSYFGLNKHQWIEASLELLKLIFQPQYELIDNMVVSRLKFPKIEYDYLDKKYEKYSFMEGLDIQIKSQEKELGFTTESVFNKLIERGIKIDEDHFQLFYGVCLYYTSQVEKQTLKFERFNDVSIYKHKVETKKKTIKGRIDISFETTSNQMFIVELKKYYHDQIGQTSVSKEDDEKLQFFEYKYLSLDQLKIRALMQAQHYYQEREQCQYEVAILVLNQITKKSEIVYDKAEKNLPHSVNELSTFYYKIYPQEKELFQQSMLEKSQIKSRVMKLEQALNGDPETEIFKVSKEEYEQEFQFLEKMDIWNKLEDKYFFDIITKSSKLLSFIKEESLITQQNNQSQSTDQIQFQSPQKNVEESEQSDSESQSFSSSFSEFDIKKKREDLQKYIQIFQQLNLIYDNENHQQNQLKRQD